MKLGRFQKFHTIWTIWTSPGADNPPELNVFVFEVGVNNLQPTGTIYGKKVPWLFWTVMDYLTFLSYLNRGPKWRAMIPPPTLKFHFTQILIKFIIKWGRFINSHHIWTISTPRGTDNPSILSVFMSEIGPYSFKFTDTIFISRYRQYRGRSWAISK